MDKVLCPWCNSEMKLEESLPFSGVYAYTCECGAVSPNECGKEEAYAAAIRRPLQKPLTLEETKIQIAVWVERLPRFEGERVAVRPETYAMEYRDEPNYGKTWRCWATKPSEEERKAAKWE